MQYLLNPNHNMKTDKYTQVFEDETRGTMNRHNKYFLNIIIATIFTIILCITLLYNSGDKTYPITNLVSTNSNFKKGLNIQNLDQVPTILPTSVPTIIQSVLVSQSASEQPTID
jgi:hypothetical protein